MVDGAGYDNAESALAFTSEARFTSSDPADYVAARNISQRETLPEPAKRPPRKRRSTKAQEGMQKQEPIRQVSANPTSGAGILGL